MNNNKFVLHLSAFLLVFSFFFVPVQADVIVGLGSGSGGFVEDRQGPDTSNAFSNRSWPRVGWSAYDNSGNAQTHPATGDVDGDGRQEVVLGLSSAANGWVKVLDDQANGFSTLKWLKVSWSGYNDSNGETWPAMGDVDGDDKDEIILGLGTGSKGWIEIRDDAGNSFSHMSWIQVGWNKYTSQSNDYTRPAAGDVDGDGNDEIIVGLSDASNGWVEIKEDQGENFSLEKWVQTSWGSYNSNQGETRPTAGDVDADGSDEIVLGLGAGSNGYMEVKDDADNGFGFMNWIQVSWGGYTGGSKDGTRPVAGNLVPGDDADEIMTGLSSAGNGWMEAKQGKNGGYSSINFTQVGWGQYNSNNGETWPAIVPSTSATGEYQNLFDVALNHALFVNKATGTAWSAGRNRRGTDFDGMLGIGDPGQFQLPALKAVVRENGDRLSDVTDVSASPSADVSLFLRKNGEVWAAGNGALKGVLGRDTANDGVDNNLNGETDEVDETAQVFALSVLNSSKNPLSGIDDIATGVDFNLYLTEDGRVLASGDNLHGELGKGDTGGEETHPVQVLESDGTALDNVVDIAAGHGHAAAVRSDGTVWVWGDDGSDEITLGRDTSSDNKDNDGDGDVDENSEDNAFAFPVLDENGDRFTGVKSVAAADAYTVALMEDGTVWGWGDNSNGQLGDGSTTSRRHPVQVTDSLGNPLTGVVAIETAGDRPGNFTSGDQHVVALLDDSTVRAWGGNSMGQLGDQTTDDQVNPVTVLDRDNNPLENVIAVEAGKQVTTVMFQDGSIHSWGNLDRGIAGTGSTNDQELINKTSELIGVTTNTLTVSDIDSQGRHTLAVLKDGTVKAWGHDTSNSLDNALKLGSVHAMDSTLDGCCRNKWVPVEVVTDASGSVLDSAEEVATGLEHSLVLLANGTVRAWGSNGDGQIGDGTTTNHPKPVPVVDSGGQTVSGFQAIDAGEDFSVGLKEDGTVWAWGDNTFGQLGDGSGTDQKHPVQVVKENGDPLGTIEQISVYGGPDGEHVVALAADGSVWTWGRNEFGQLGDGTTTDRNGAVKVTGLNNVTDIAAGADHVLALLESGSVMAWGLGDVGQLGRNTATDGVDNDEDGSTDESGEYVQVSPREVVTSGGQPITVAAVSAGENHSLAIDPDDKLIAWGDNSLGKLGVGDVGSDSKHPRLVVDPEGSNFGSVKAVVGGTNHTVIVMPDDTLRYIGPVLGRGVGGVGDRNDSVDDRVNPFSTPKTFQPWTPFQEPPSSQ